jgi:uroporphyrinogen-III synthase
VGEALGQEPQQRLDPAVANGNDRQPGRACSSGAGLALLHLAGEERIPPVRPRQRITSVTVYRMAELPLPGAALIEGAVVLVHSPAAGRRLADTGVARDRVRIAAISQAAADACGSGWAHCEAAAEPNDTALLGLAAKLCEEQA